MASEDHFASRVTTELLSAQDHPTQQKDSKFSWLVCAIGIQTQIFILGVLHAFGVFFVDFNSEFKTSKALIAWIGSVAYGLSMTFGPVTSILVNRYGHRPVMITGGLLCSVSVLSSSFITDLPQLFATFSVIYGIGTCMSISPTMTIAPQYFDKYVTLAVGLLTAGSSVGTLVMAPVSQLLIESIGWRNTFRFFAGTCVISALCCSFIKPVSPQVTNTVEKIKRSPARKLMQELKLWKNRVFVVWTLAVTCVMFGYYIPYVHLVSYAKDNGIPPEKGSILVMTLGATTAAGRILFGKIVASGVLNRLHMHQLSMVVTGTAIMLLPLVKSFIGIIIYVVIVGLVDGCYVVLLPVLTTSLMVGENSVTAWGFLIGTSSITFTLGPPVAGALYDTFGSYNVAFHCAGIPVICGAIILFFIPWAQKTSKTNNIMVVVSEHDVEDEDYDFATDLLEEAREIKDDQSETDRVNRTVSIEDIQIRFPRKPSLRRYRDQGTSTSPDIQSVPSDVTETIAMLKENARLIAEMLEGAKLQPRVEQVQANWSTKSRSEMVQPTMMDIQPQKMISIMSIPGGLTISHWEPQPTHDAVPSSDSVSNPPSMLASQSLLQDVNSFHSRNISDSQEGSSPSLYAVSPGQVSASFREGNDIFSRPCSIPTPVHTRSTEVAGNPFDKTIIDQVDYLKEKLKSPSNEKRGVAQYTGIISPEQQQCASQCQEGLTGPQQQVYTEQLQQGMTNMQQQPSSPMMQQDMVISQQSKRVTEGSMEQQPAPSATSPRIVTTPPMLCAIPEVPNVCKDQDILQTSHNIDNNGEESDKWLDNSPNDPHFCHKSDEILTNVRSADSQASSASVHSTCNLSATGSNSGESSKEIDVFKHLFDDHDEALS